MQYCDDAAANLSSALTELQTQHDSARDLIQETFENYKKVLENCRDQAMVELEKLHSERELKIMDLMQNIENTMGKIDNTCKFTNRVLEQANAAEFLSMKKLIAAQFINLINTTPKCDINYSLTFDTKADKFEQIAQETFGKFRTESTPPSPKESTPPPTLPGMPPNMMNSGRVVSGGGNVGMNCSGSSQGQLASSVTASSPISLPTSMQSSFDGDLYALGNGFMMSNVLTPDSPPQSQSAMLHHNHQLQHQNSTSSHHSGINGFNSIGSLASGAGANLSNLNSSSAGMNGGSLAGSQLGSGLNGGPLIGPQGLNALNGPVPSNGLNSLNSPLNNNLAASLNGAIGGSGGVVNGPPNGGYNSILEYNLSRLASLTENTPDTLNDALVVPPAAPPNQSIVSASNSQNQHITLADLLSGDQRAFNNLQALAKLGLNNNGKSHILLRVLLFCRDNTTRDNFTCLFYFFFRFFSVNYYFLLNNHFHIQTSAMARMQYSILSSVLESFKKSTSYQTRTQWPNMFTKDSLCRFDTLEVILLKLHRLIRHNNRRLLLRT